MSRRDARSCTPQTRLCGGFGTDCASTSDLRTRPPPRPDTHSPSVCVCASTFAPDRNPLAALPGFEVRAIRRLPPTEGEGEGRRRNRGSGVWREDSALARCRGSSTRAPGRWGRPPLADVNFGAAESGGDYRWFWAQRSNGPAVEGATTGEFTAIGRPPMLWLTHSLTRC